MRLSDLIASIQMKNRALPPRLVDQAVRHVFREIESRLIDGGRVELRGFGVLEVREREGGARRNPATGGPVIVPARRAIHWRTGTALANAVNDRELDRRSPGAWRRSSRTR